MELSAPLPDWGLVCACNSLVHAAISTESSCVQLPCGSRTVSLLLLITSGSSTLGGPSATTIPESLKEDVILMAHVGLSTLQILVLHTLASRGLHVKLLSTACTLKHL